MNTIFLSNKAAAISWAAQVMAAVILCQTLYFKFTGAPESIYIFETVGMEPVGRIGSGIVELIASALLLMPSAAWVGALLGLGVISGALFFHLTRLGVVVMDDGGLLFGLAVTTFVCCATVLIVRRGQIPVIGRRS